MNGRWIFKSSALALAVAAAALLVPATPTLAFDSDLAACVSQCVSDGKACEDTARADEHQCEVDNGCPALIDAAKAACEADPESAECETARAAAHACVEPCKDDQKADRAGCRAARLECLRDECGLDDVALKCGHFKLPHTP